MKFLVILLLLFLGIMALRRRLTFMVHRGSTTPRDAARREKEEAKRREGEVTIDPSVQRRKDDRVDNGDYTDYEELK